MAHDVFLSYSRKDSAMKDRVQKSLADAGLSVWTDANLTPGTPEWFQAIERAIDATRVLVVLLSPDAKQSEWVQKEIGYAKAWKKPIFPILVRGDEAESTPFQIFGTQYVDVRANSRFSGEMDRLVVTLRQSIPFDPPVPARVEKPMRPAQPPIPHNTEDESDSFNDWRSSVFDLDADEDTGDILVPPAAEPPTPPGDNIEIPTFLRSRGGGSSTSTYTYGSRAQKSAKPVSTVEAKPLPKRLSGLNPLHQVWVLLRIFFRYDQAYKYDKAVADVHRTWRSAAYRAKERKPDAESPKAIALYREQYEQRREYGFGALLLLYALSFVFPVLRILSGQAAYPLAWTALPQLPAWGWLVLPVLLVVISWWGKHNREVHPPRSLASILANAIFNFGDLLYILVFVLFFHNFIFSSVPGDVGKLVAAMLPVLALIMINSVLSTIFKEASLALTELNNIQTFSAWVFSGMYVAHRIARDMLTNESDLGLALIAAAGGAAVFGAYWFFDNKLGWRTSDNYLFHKSRLFRLILLLAIFFLCAVSAWIYMGGGWGTLGIGGTSPA